MWRIIFALLLPLNCFAQPITVTSAGETFEVAKLNGFRIAVENKLGTIVITEREQRNHNMVRNNIQVHSAGYVDDYKILSSVTSENNVTLLMEVNVSESKLRNFLLAEPKNTKEFNTDRHQTQINTYYHERRTGDQLISSLMQYYPYNAFNVKQHPYELKIDSRRGTFLVIPYELTWNYDFLVALNNTVRQTHDARTGFMKSPLAYFSIMYKDPKSLFLGESNMYGFNDLTRFNFLKELFTNENEPRLKLTISRSTSQTAINICTVPNFLTGRQRSFYRIGYANEITVFGNERENHSVIVELGRNSEFDLNGITYINISIVANKDCKQQRYR